MSIVLHPHQTILKSEIYAAWAIGYRNVCAVLPTGGGKSVVMSQLVLEGLVNGLKQVVVAHRNELVCQMSMHLANRGIPHRIVGSAQTVALAVRQHRKKHNKSFINPSAPTAVVGVDTLMARSEELSRWAKQIDRWYIDECHHTIGNERVEPNKWGKAVQIFENAHGLGVTATPVRADGQGLGREYDGVFDFMVKGPEARWLIENNFLSDYEIVCPISDLNVSNDELSANGDWSSQTLRKAAKKSHIVGDVVQNYLKYAKDRKAIVFATDVETAGEIAAKFEQAGVKAIALSAKTNSSVREHAIEQFKEGKIKVLINVDLFDEGFDVPDCEVVILARPTASLGKYRQQVGRALRYVAGKTALIIDHVSNVIRHGLPDKFIDWNLCRRDKRAKQLKDPEELLLVACRNCARPHEKFRVCCPHCGYKKPLPEGGGRSIEVVEGDLILLDKETLERMRQSTVLESPADIANRVASVAGIIAGRGAANRQIEKIEAHKNLSDTIAQWAAIERQKGFTDSEICRKFYHTLGVDVVSVLNGKNTKAEFEQFKNTIERWYM